MAAIYVSPQTARELLAQWPSNAALRQQLDGLANCKLRNRAATFVKSVQEM